MNNNAFAFMNDEDWLNQGKSDAWAGKPKQTPEHDPQAASMYDLGYCEGAIKRSPIKDTKKKKINKQ
ncbi:conserved hypothetical protein [Hyella patelloides LEGE 07179]|uniref:Uncharacterized protein n=1 Tax=Hyella patelloides LEGE 07179 TaxID=945734 RepID=A0A563VUG5_9CYAN|nr:hypothetical protein [Hyella patelloides]VEP14911.1 conserved hypothetical protein [Hyella patelloides LEGE 07179]